MNFRVRPGDSLLPAGILSVFTYPSRNIVQLLVVLLLHFDHLSAREGRGVFEINAEHGAPEHEMTEQGLGISGFADDANPSGLRHVQACHQFEPLELVTLSTGFHVFDESGVALVLRFSRDLSVTDVVLHEFQRWKYGYRSVVVDETLGLIGVLLTEQLEW